MANVGASGANLVHKWLNILRGTAFTVPSGVFMQIHKGQPGSAGTSNVSAQTARSQVSFAAPSAGAIALTGTPPSFNITATETISHVSFWSAASGGEFLWSADMTASKSVEAGDTLTITSAGLGIGPLAA